MFLFSHSQGDHTYSAWAGGDPRAMNLMSQYVKSISHIYATTAFSGSTPQGSFVHVVVCFDLLLFPSSYSCIFSFFLSFFNALGGMYVSVYFAF